MSNNFGFNNTKDFLDICVETNPVLGREDLSFEDKIRIFVEKGLKEGGYPFTIWWAALDRDRSYCVVALSAR